MKRMTDDDNTTEISLYAFWKYDLFPFVVGGKVTKMTGDGKCFAPSYQGWVNPIKLLPVEAGEELMEDIKQRKLEYDQALESLEEHHREQLEYLLPWIQWP
jgi:hypothetical protein